MVVHDRSPPANPSCSLHVGGEEVEAWFDPGNAGELPAVMRPEGVSFMVFALFASLS